MASPAAPTVAAFSHAMAEGAMPFAWTPWLIVTSLALFAAAGIAEIGGSWLVWQARREGRPWWWALLGAIVLIGLLLLIQRCFCPLHCNIFMFAICLTSNLPRATPSMHSSQFTASFPRGSRQPPDSAVCWLSMAASSLPCRTPGAGRSTVLVPTRAISWAPRLRSPASRSHGFGLATAVDDDRLDLRLARPNELVRVCTLSD